MRIIFGGDSLFTGFGANNINPANVFHLRHYAKDIGVGNVAVAGDRMHSNSVFYAGGSLQRFRDAVLGRGATHYCVCIMTNDAHDLTVGQLVESKSRYDTLLTEAQASGLQVVVCTMPPRGTGPSWVTTQPKFDDLNSFIASKSSTHPGVVVCDLRTALRDPSNHANLLPAYAQADGLHLTSAACTRIVDELDAIDAFGHMSL